MAESVNECTKIEPKISSASFDFSWDFLSPSLSLPSSVSQLPRDDPVNDVNASTL